MWSCPGCGHGIAESDADTITDHVNECDRVDGAGQALAGGTRIMTEVPRGVRTVAGIPVRITELVWNNAGRSFEVHRDDDDTDLTQDGCFDVMPSDDQIEALITEGTYDARPRVSRFFTCPPPSAAPGGRHPAGPAVRRG